MTELQTPPGSRQEKENKEERRASIATQEECESTVKELLQKLKIVHPRFQCSSSNEVTHLCINHKCKEKSLCCQLENCQACFNSHLICPNIKLHGISHLLEKFTEGRRQFLLKLFQVENSFIESIYNKRKRLIQKYYWGNIQPKYRQIIDSLYFNHIENYQIDSGLADQFFNRLKREVYDKKQVSNDLLADFRKEIDELGLTFENMEKRIIEAFNYSNLMRSIIKTQSSFLQGSKIVEGGDADNRKFVRESLCNPTKVQLVFRASDHQFQALKFHKYCDNIPNTFTLIKTEFNNVIAGFTPIPWNVAPNAFAYETTNSSFILSLDQKQKMKLVNSDKAVGCSAVLGPLFGEYDVRVADRCNSNYESFSNFPQSYNTDPPYPKNQHTTSVFCGATSGNRFKVVQYEVYRVSWQK